MGGRTEQIISTFGHYILGTTAGESHGKTVCCIIENSPPGLSLSESDIQLQLKRRRPCQSAITTPRDERDRATKGSGCEFGRMCDTPTGSHNVCHDAVWTEASSGGGRSSRRETIARVVAGAVAEKRLRETYGIEMVAFVSCFDKLEALLAVCRPRRTTAAVSGAASLTACPSSREASALTQEHCKGYVVSDDEI
ncbi:chorismate synthase [Colletotrichum gloeosporioides Cg-14]|uniref:chorismate synthase n=1 Tax=Colletotrichum gloeosporioides (strain Cg-14) TaxID=1237896 RepID=T0KRB8_COLGC|nr:chorismate synthase [Colletotrichum gloeosporioides Cg-14]